MNKPLEKIIVNGRMVRQKYHCDAGTIRVYPKDDKQGRVARLGRDTNWDYSDYYNPVCVMAISGETLS